MSENAAVGSLLSVSSACCWVGHLRAAITAAVATLQTHWLIMENLIYFMQILFNGQGSHVI